MPSPGIEPGPHWWEASALTTAPSLHPHLPFAHSFALLFSHHYDLSCCFNYMLTLYAEILQFVDILILNDALCLMLLQFFLSIKFIFATHLPMNSFCNLNSQLSSSGPSCSNDGYGYPTHKSLSTG